MTSQNVDAYLIDICKSKRWFETRSSAKLKINRLRQINKHTRLEPYRCNVCQGFHLTSKTDMQHKTKARSKRR